MGDVFHEQLVIRRKSSSERLKQVGLVTAGVVVGLITAFIPIINTMFWLFIVLAIWGAVYLARSYNVEFEYAVTNYFLDIDKIIAQRKRQRLVSLDIRKIDYFISSKDTNYKAQKNDNNIKKTIDCTSNSGEENIYAIITNIEGVKTRILIEPNKDIIDAIYKYLQKKPYQIYK